MTTYTGESVFEIENKPNKYTYTSLSDVLADQLHFRKEDEDTKQPITVKIDAAGGAQEEPHVRRRKDQTWYEQMISDVAGNYCSPYWSDGKIQVSVDGTMPALSTDDSACRAHDACLYYGNDPLFCDEEFLQSDANYALKFAIGSQALARRLYRKVTNTNTKMAKTNLRFNNTDSPINPKNGKPMGASKNKPNFKNALRRVQAQYAAPSVSMPRAPAATSVALSNFANAPQLNSVKRGVVLRHSEMIGAAFTGAGAPTALNSVGLTINAGKFETFPWLATMATSYDRYRFRKLSFSYLPLVPTSTAGRMGLGYDYDSSDSVPLSRQDFYSLTRHSDGPVWSPLSLNIPVDNTIRFTNTHTTVDSKLIDLGKLIVFTDATSATASSSIGDIICEYEVELLDPQQSTYATQKYKFANPTLLTPVTSTGPAVSTLVLNAGTIETLTISAGVYHINMIVSDTGAASPTLTLTLTNCTLTDSLASAATTTLWSKLNVISCPNGQGTVAMTLGGVAGFDLCETVMYIVTKVATEVTDV